MFTISLHALLRLPARQFRRQRETGIAEEATWSEVSGCVGSQGLFGLKVGWAASTADPEIVGVRGASHSTGPMCS